jgi:hypothetical protein
MMIRSVIDSGRRDGIMFPITFALVVVLLQCSTMVMGHGRLVTPAPRAVEGQFLNLPIDKPWGSNQVCKNRPAATPALTLTAGQSTTVKWSYSANHVGDCFMYLSYDGVRFFKIAEWAKCNTMNNQNVQMTIPSYLPSCTACIMRYEWYALHVWPSIELYVDCVDVRIVGSSSGQLPSPTVVIPGHLPLDGGSSTNPKYRNEYDSSIAFFFTGPRVATLSGGGGTTPTTPVRSSSTATSVIRSSTASARSSSSTGTARVSSTGTSSRLSSTGGASIPSTPTDGIPTIVISQVYRISYTRYQADQTNYRAAFLNTLAYTAKPHLDASSLAVVSVTRVDAEHVKVVFTYTPPVLPSALTVEEAIAAGRADNTTETMEVEASVPPQVELSEAGYTGSTGDNGETSISGDVSASTGATLGSASTHSPLLCVTALVTGTLALWMGNNAL